MLQKLSGLVAATGLIFCVACAQTDAGITTNVKTKLAADSTVKAYKIDVDTKNHVVTLTGDVETAAAKEQALQIARNTDGVTDVIDQLHVGETTATGGVLDRSYDETKQLGTEAADKTKELGRETVDKTKEVGRDIAGATRDAGGTAKDAAITTAVKSKFIADSSVKGLRIDVDTSNGIVTLTGSASSRAEADRAVVLARNTDGVARVVDNLHVGN